MAIDEIVQGANAAGVTTPEEFLAWAARTGLEVPGRLEVGRIDGEAIVAVFIRDDETAPFDERQLVCHDGEWAEFGC